MNRKTILLAVLFVGLTVFGACMSVSKKVLPKVDGVLLNHYGAPMSDVMVSLGDMVTTTDTNGEFTFGHVTSGAQMISIFPEEHEFHTVQPIQISEGIGVIAVYAKDDNNMITNPGIEFLSDESPDDWVRYVPSGNGSSDGLQVSSDAHTGNHSLFWDISEGLKTNPERLRLFWRQGIPSDRGDEGDTYVFSFFYKTANGDPAPRLTIERRKPDDSTWNIYVNLDPSEDWTYVEREFEWPVRGNLNFGIWADRVSTSNPDPDSKLWVDDIKVFKKN